MWKFIDMTGFRTSSTTYAYITKYKQIDTSIECFKFCMTNDFGPTTEYLFEDSNIYDISKFHDFLKFNGSIIIQDYISSQFKLIGRKFMYINKDTPFYTLRIFNSHPGEESLFSRFDIEPTKTRLIDIIAEEWEMDFEDPYWDMIIDYNH